MKKIAMFFLSCVFAVALAACGATVQTYTANPSVPVVVPAPPAAK